MRFKIDSTWGCARTGRLLVNGRVLNTPAFLPVATLACVRGIDSETLFRLGVEGVICNTLHLHSFPGEEIVSDLGGLHSFMGYSGVIFTDSGGFQAFSLGDAMEHGVGKIAGFFPGQDYRPVHGKEKWIRITERGIHYRNPTRCVKLLLTPEKSVEIQKRLGADVMYALDECTSPLASREYTRMAMERTHRWAIRCLNAKGDGNMFGIVQGGEYKDLRVESAKFMASLPFDGYGIGGSLGKTKSDMLNVLEWVIPFLPFEKPRHLLGIGGVEDIFESVMRGVDIFDCVGPTRWARRGRIFVSPDGGGNRSNKFMFKIRSAKYSSDPSPPDPACECPVCQTYSRAYLRHLYKSEPLNFCMLASLHNVCFFINLMERIREEIREGNFESFLRSWLV